MQPCVLDFYNLYWDKVINNLKKANHIGKKAFYRGEMPVGLYLQYKNQNIYFHNHNKVHCEMLVEPKFLLDNDVFLSHEPCPMCFFYFSLCKVRNIFFLFANSYYKLYNAEQMFLRHINFHYFPQCYGPFYNVIDCENYLIKFFKNKRTKKRLLLP